MTRLFNLLKPWIEEQTDIYVSELYKELSSFTFLRIRKSKLSQEELTAMKFYFNY